MATVNRFLLPLFIISATAACLGVVGCEQDTDTVCTEAPGQETYGRFCSGCHGAAGADEPKGGALYVELAGQGLDRSWRRFVREGSEGRFGTDSKMKSYGADEISDAALDGAMGYLLAGNAGGLAAYVGNCGMCHGLELDGVKAPDGEVKGPPLSGDGLREVWRKITVEGVPTPEDGRGMPALPLCDGDIDAVVDYLVGQVAPDGPPCSKGGDECLKCGGQAGEALYDAYCAGCHGKDSAGRPVADGRKVPGLTGVGLEAWWRGVVRDGSKARFGADSQMRGYPATELSDDDVDKLLAYLVGNSSEGQPLYAGRCAMCHGATREGETVGGKLWGPALAGDPFRARWAQITAEGPKHRRQEWPFDYDMYAFPFCADELESLTSHLAGRVDAATTACVQATSNGAGAQCLQCDNQSGEAIYGLYCAGCHGATGVEGRQVDGVQLYPGLKGQGRKRWWTQLIREGTRGRFGDESVMEPIAADALSDEDLEPLVDFLVAEDRGQPDRATSRLLIQACNCHGQNLQGGSSGPSIGGPGLREVWAKMTHDGPLPLAGGQARLVEDGGEQRPAMPSFPLCEEELTRLMEFLEPSPSQE